MKRLISILFMSFAAVAALAQSPVRPVNIPTDTIGPFRSDVIISSSLDSSQFSNATYIPDSADYEWNKKAKKKKYKKTATNSSSRTMRKANASSKKYK